MILIGSKEILIQRRFNFHSIFKYQQLRKSIEKTTKMIDSTFSMIFFLFRRLREERVDDRNQISEQKSREHTSHNGKLLMVFEQLFHQNLLQRRYFCIEQIKFD